MLPALFAGIVCRAIDADKSAKILAEIDRKLALAHTPHDSLALLYDKFDLTNFSERPEVGELAYQVAVRAGDRAAQLDLLRLLGNRAYYDINKLNEYLRIVNNMSPGDDQRETLTFLRLVMAKSDAADTTPETENKRRQELSKLFNESSRTGVHGMSAYDKFENIFSTCIYLQNLAPGQMLLDKLSELEHVISSLPGDNMSLKSMYYNFAVSAYLVADKKQEALSFADKLGDLTRSLEKYYHDNGRYYRSYDEYYYLLNWRKMACYDMLSLHQVDSLYDNIKMLARHDPDVKEQLEVKRIPEIFYLMKHKDYAGALDILKKVYPETKALQRELLVRQYVIAAKEVKDDDALRFALSEYNHLLEKRLQDKLLGSALRLQYIYNNSQLYEDNIKLLDRNRELSQTLLKRRIIYGITGVLCLCVLILLFLMAYRRARRQSALLSQTNEKLMRERDALRSTHKSVLETREKANVADRLKTDFIHDISHEITEPINAIVGYTQLIVDSVEGSRREILDKFMVEIRENAVRLQNLVADVLESGRPVTAGGKARYIELCLSDVMDKAVFYFTPDFGARFGLAFRNVSPDKNLVFTSDVCIIDSLLASMFEIAGKVGDHDSIRIDYGENSDNNLFVEIRIKPNDTIAELSPELLAQIDELNVTARSIHGNVRASLSQSHKLVLRLEFNGMVKN